MTQYKYILEPYAGLRSRYYCPQCNGKNEFTRYIDAETGDHLDSKVGICNRAVKCGYHYKPKEYFQDNNINFNTLTFKNMLRPKIDEQPTKPVSFIPLVDFKITLRETWSVSQIALINNFIKYLKNLFGPDITGELISKYYLGTSAHWTGANIFWQIDINGSIRTGKIMLYDPVTGKRIKEPYEHISWVHKDLKIGDFELGQCLFGEHLLQDKLLPVALVESEKTAIIASVYLPQFIWLATGGINNFNKDKFEGLRGRTVLLFPDLNGYKKWSDKADELSHIANFKVVDIFERTATTEEIENGLDLADYLVKHDYRDFIQKEVQSEIVLTEQTKTKFNK